MRFADGYYTHHPMVDYFNAMDPEIYGQVPAGKDAGVTLGVEDIGMSVPMGISATNVAGVYSKIRMGAGKIEIQFPGYKTGQRQAQTPGMLGEDQRQAMRELQMANEVRMTTHSSFGIMGMMGRDERGNFSTMGSYGDMLELKRAIDFQADISGGGSVVVHSGEFERPMTDMHLDDETHRLNLARDPNGRLLVRQYHVQEFDAKFDLLDSRTSQKMETVQKDRLVAYPVWNKAKNYYSYIAKKEDPSGMPEGSEVHVKKGDYIDYENRKITDPWHPLRGRVPEYDPETGRFNTKLRHFDYFKEEAEEYDQYLREKLKREPDYYEKVYPEEMFLRATLETQEGHSRGWALQYGERTEHHLEAIRKLKEARKYYEQLDKSIPKNEKWKIMRAHHKFGGMFEQFVPPETKHPLEIINFEIREHEKGLEFARQASTAQEQQALDTRETKINLITPMKRLEQHGVRMYAEAAVHAMQKTRDPNNPIVVTIENLFPERFGGHLEEVKWLIKKSREKMVELLTEPKIQLGVSRLPVDMDEEKLNAALTPGRKEFLQENPFYLGVSEEEAEKIAARHIKATLDTGHLNMWKKYWQDDPKLSMEENDKTYKKWYLQQVESLAKENMVGNVHMADNFGYQDDHLAPGQGNAPIKEVVEILKKYGYDRSYTVEPGADATTDLSDFHGLMKTWRHFGAPVYGVGLGPPQIPQRWTDVQYSYFGQNKPPYYIFGPYAPSNDWTMWSAVPLE